MGVSSIPSGSVRSERWDRTGGNRRIHEWKRNNFRKTGDECAVTCLCIGVRSTMPCRLTESIKMSRIAKFDGGTAPSICLTQFCFTCASHGTPGRFLLLHSLAHSARRCSFTSLQFKCFLIRQSYAYEGGRRLPSVGTQNCAGTGCVILLVCYVVSKLMRQEYSTQESTSPIEQAYFMLLVLY